MSPKNTNLYCCSSLPPYQHADNQTKRPLCHLLQDPLSHRTFLNAFLFGWEQILKTNKQTMNFTHIIFNLGLWKPLHVEDVAVCAKSNVSSGFVCEIQT